MARRSILSAHRFVLALALLIAILIAAACQAATPTSVPPTQIPPTAISLTSGAQAARPSCSQGTLQVSLLQTPVPVTLVPTATVPNPTAPPPTATPRSAPKDDHVGFPTGYQDNFKLLFVFDRTDTKQIRVVCGNDLAASWKAGQPFPYGSVMIFESWRPKEDEKGNVIKDDKGHLIRQTLTTIFAMRKEKGFGADYGGLRNGELEYVAYRPDKSIATAPANTANCASCHLGATQAQDFVFHTELISSATLYAQTAAIGSNEVGMEDIAFYPTTLNIKVGTTLKFTNNDVGIAHTVTANDNSFDSGVLNSGGSFSFTFNTAGTFEYHCTIHPEQMKAKIVVTQ